MEKPSNLDELDQLIAEEKMQSDHGINEAEIRNNIRNSEKISREVKAQLNEKWKKEDTDRITVGFIQIVLAIIPLFKGGK